ncbi:MAG: type II toxin-antitoxin system RelE/ParE family toxin [Treponema sp.]|nr:type II toxin-antitoxin system RelE/ParE family toxin [Treponema sp.]
MADEYLEWFSRLSEHDKEAILIKVHLLVEFGPELSRPHADTLHGSKITNMKELRAKTNGHIYRIAYYFNNKRQGILLAGGDKKGMDEKLFYKDLIRPDSTGKCNTAAFGKNLSGGFKT